MVSSNKFSRCTLPKSLDLQGGFKIIIIIIIYGLSQKCFHFLTGKGGREGMHKLLRKDGILREKINFITIIDGGGALIKVMRVG